MLDKIKKIKLRIKEKYGVYREFFKQTYNKHIIYLYIAVSIFVALIIEMMARGSFIEGIFYLIKNPYVFLCNAVIVLMTLSFSLLIRRRFFAMALISALWLAAGVTNAVLLSNRVTPFTATDLVLIDTAFKVIDKYFSLWQVILVIAVIVLCIAGLVFMYLKAPKVNHKIKYGRNIVAILIIWALGFGGLNLGVASELIPRNFGNLRDCYMEYGFVYCFSNSLVNTGVSKPESYSDEKIKEITTDEKEENKVKKKPNIIFVQLESFFDIKNLKKVKFSENPTPNFDKLMEEYPSGYFSVPVVGAGTVNTEFEIMTGMNMDTFGPGEYPFKTILKDTTCESICYNLKEYGYKCHAIHNNTATFYGRNTVFSNLGYDTFTSIEYMNVEEFTPMGWAKDYYLTDNIIDTLKSTKGQDFIYTISVQGHGKYPTDGDYDYPIKVRKVKDQELKNQYQYYVWQINEMDKFIGELIQAVDDLGEDSIVVMYGDHLPSLGILSENLKNKDVYQTEYFIWSNFENGYTDEDIEAYQLESKILKELNMTAGKINNYTQQHKDDDYNEYQEGLQNLEYDMLYGDYIAWGGENPYVATDLKLGLYDITVSSISPLEDDIGTVYIYGKHFTNYSKVYINDEAIDTTYIDPNTIMVVYPELKDGDSISVHQENEESELSQTEPYVYNTDEIKPSKNSKKKSNKKSKKQQ